MKEKILDIIYETLDEINEVLGERQKIEKTKGAKLYGKNVRPYLYIIISARPRQCTWNSCVYHHNFSVIIEKITNMILCNG